MIRTCGLTHVALAVRYLERSIEFYRGVFGSEVVYRDADSAQLQTPGTRDVLVLEQHRRGTSSRASPTSLPGTRTATPSKSGSSFRLRSIPSGGAGRRLGLMIVRWILAALHLVALGIGLGAVYVRAQALRGPLDVPGLRRVFAADSWWGAAAGLWIVTGLLRAFGGYEKGTEYYLHNHLFLTKMGLLVLILILEFGVMLRLILWRRAVARGTLPDTHRASRYATISVVQTVLVLLMVAAATGMARGFGAR